MCWLLQGERGREGVREERRRGVSAAAACVAPTRVLGVGLEEKNTDGTGELVAVTA